MRTVTFGVSSREEISDRFIAAFKGNAQGAHISFASHELLFQTLTPLRWSLIRSIMGAGPLSICEIARRVTRDVKCVRRDVHALLDVGVLVRNADGAIEFPYDVVHVDFLMKND